MVGKTCRFPPSWRWFKGWFSYGTGNQNCWEKLGYHWLKLVNWSCDDLFIGGHWLGAFSASVAVYLQVPWTEERWCWKSGMWKVERLERYIHILYIYNIYVYESNVDELPFAPPKIVGNLALSQIGGPIKSPNIFKGFLWGCASFELAEI